MALVRLSEYAERHGLTVDAVQSMANRGRFTTLTARGRVRYVDENEPYPATVELPPAAVTDKALRAIGRAYRACQVALGRQDRPVDPLNILHPWRGLSNIVLNVHQCGVLNPELNQMLGDTFDLCDGTEAAIAASVPLDRQGSWWIGYYTYDTNK